MATLALVSDIMWICSRWRIVLQDYSTTRDIATAFGAIAGILAAAQSPASAQDATHGIVTTIELKGCQPVAQAAGGKSWRCAGLPGYPVLIAETDDRTFLTVGPTPEKRRASTQTLRAPNTLFPAANRATIEWRVTHVSQATRKPAPAIPYATIVRYFTARNAARGQVLIVSKVTPTETCQVALIDAEANADALALARRIADTNASSFDCSKPPSIVGSTGKSPM